MSPTPIRWVTASGLGRVTAAVQAAMEAWARNWGLLVPEVCAAEVLTMSDAARALSAMRPLTDATVGQVFMGVDPEWSAGWVEALLGDGADSSSALARDVALLAQQALVDSLVQAFRPLDHVAQVGPDPARAVPGHWGARLRWQWAGSTGELAVAWGALQANGWETPPSPARLPAWLPEEAMADLPVPLTAVLCHVDVPVTDLADLDIGDVVMLGQRAAQTMRLHVAGCGLALSARLVGNNNRRAAQVVAAHAMESR